MHTHSHLSKAFSFLLMVTLLFSSYGTALAQEPGPIPTEPPAINPIPQPTQSAVDSGFISLSIRGKVTDAGGNGVEGVQVVDDQAHSTLTGADGVYILAGLTTGEYVVRTVVDQSVLIPYYRVVTLLDQDVSGVDFYPPAKDQIGRQPPTRQPDDIVRQPASTQQQLFPLSPHPLSPPEQNQPAENDLSSQAAYKTGAPGLAFRYSSQLGTSLEHYLTEDVSTISHLNAPSGIALDVDGKLLVTEERGKRLLRFTSGGIGDLSIGKSGIPYAEVNVFQRPLGVAAGPGGSIWMGDQNRLVKYDPNLAADNQFRLQFPATDPGISGSDHGRFNEVRDIAFNADGSEMYVSDRFNNRVEVFTFSGENPVWARTIGVTGVPGSDQSHFNEPFYITYYSANLYVADILNHRIQQCPPAGGTCTTFAGISGVPGNDTTHLNLPTAITFWGSYSYISDAGNNRVLRCDLAGKNCSHFAGTAGEPGADNAHFSWPGDIQADASGQIFITDEDNSRIQIFDGSTKAYIGTRGTSTIPYVTDNSHLNRPWGIGISPIDGSIYVAENLGFTLVKFDSGGNFVWRKGQAGIFGADAGHFGNFEVGNTGDMAFDKLGRIYMPDSGNYRIKIYNPDGTVFGQIGGEAGSENNQFGCLGSVAISPINGDIFAADSCNHRVQVFDSQHSYKTTLGETGVSGTDSVHFNHPSGVAVDKQGNLYIADRDNMRVQKCTLAGTSITCAPFAGVTGLGGNSYRFTNSPIAVRVGPDGLIYIVEEGQNRVQVYDPDGGFRTALGGTLGLASGALRAPSGVAAASNGDVFVTDRENARVVRFSRGVPGWSQLNINGFGEQWNGRATALTPVTISGEKMIYALTNNTSDQPYSPEVWRMAPDGTWSAVSAPGFGDLSNTQLVDMIVFQDYLYVNTANLSTGLQVWRCALTSNCDEPADWEKKSPAAIDPKNTVGTVFSIFKNNLYLSTANFYTDSGGSHSDGPEIWRFTGTDWDTNPVLKLDAALSGGIVFQDFQSMAVVGDTTLYAGTGSWDFTPNAQIWSSTDGVNWTKYRENGITDSNNFSITALLAFKGQLYAGTANIAAGAMIYRLGSSPAADEIVFPGSFPDSANTQVRGLAADGAALYAVTTNVNTGLQIWNTSSGAVDSWTKILTDDGFGNNNNTQIDLSSSLYLNPDTGRLYVGTWNEVNGGGVWVSDPPILSAFQGSVQSAGIGLGGVTITLQPSAKVATTLLDGTYSFSGLPAGSYTLYPGKPGYAFSPLSRVVVLGSGVPPSQDFTATSVPFNLLTPPDAAQLDSLAPVNLAWESAPGAGKYNLQISTSSTFLPLLKNVTQAGTTYLLSGLSANKQYYWRVRQFAPELGSWSAVYWFSTPTLAPPSAPSLLAPPTGAALLPGIFRPTLSWKPAAVPKGSSRVDHYHVQISQKNTFAALDLDETTLNNTTVYAAPYNLLPNRIYFWRVSAVNILGVSSLWSAIRSFKVLPGPLSSGAIVDANTLTPSFNWSDAWNTGKYTLQVCRVAGSKCVTVKTASVAGLYFPLTTPLVPLQTYRWRVQAVGTTGAGPWMDGIQWTTLAAPPLSPLLVAPLNNEVLPNSVHPDFPPQLSWSNVVGAGNTYEIQVAAQMDFNPAAVVYKGKPSSSQQTVGGLNRNAAYWWRVRTCSSTNNCSLWSLVRKMVIKPEIPTNLSQFDSISSPLVFDFSWEDLATFPANNYTLQVCRDELCTIPFTTVNTTIVSAQAALPGDTELWWRVRGNGPKGVTGDFSSTVSFTTSNPPPIPHLLTPLANAVAPDSSAVLLTWQDLAPDGANYYILQISSDINFSNLLYTDTLSFPTADVKISGGTVWWRVNACDVDAVCSPFSAGRKLLLRPYVSGRVTSLAGNSIQDATVTLAGGGTTTTDIDGIYILADQPTGLKTITVSKDGSLPQTRQLALANGKAYPTADFNLADVNPAPSAFRIVVTWDTFQQSGINRDLSGHLWLPLSPAATQAHIYNGNIGSLATFPHAAWTGKGSAGMEVFDISQFEPGKYVFGVSQDRINPPSLKWSGINTRVEVYEGTLLRKSCLSPSGTGAWWYAFDLNKPLVGVPTITCKNKIQVLSPRPYIDNTITGSVLQENLRPVSGVTLNYGPGSTLSSQFGYVIKGPGPGDYTITPTKEGFTFLPPTQTVAMGSINVDFIAIPNSTAGGAPTVVKVQGDFAYLAAGSRLDIVNIQNKSAPALVGQLWISQNTIRGMALNGDFLYLAQGEDGLNIINIAKPSDPIWVGGLDQVNGGHYQDVAVSGRYAYAVDGNQLSVIDISNPYQPRRIAAGPLQPDTAQHIAVSGNYVYTVGTGGGFVYNVSNPGIFTWDQITGSSLVSSAILVDRDLAYVIFGSLLKIVAYDPSNSQSPLTDLGSLDPLPAAATGLAKSGNYLLISAGNSGLLVIDVSDPLNPHQVGSYIPGTVTAGVGAQDNFAYLLTPTQMRIVDITRKNSPLLSGNYPVIP